MTTRKGTNKTRANVGDSIRIPLHDGDTCPNPERFGGEVVEVRKNGDVYVHWNDGSGSLVYRASIRRGFAILNG